MTHDCNHAGPSPTSRRRLLQTGAIVLGAGLLGIDGSAVARGAAWLAVPPAGGADGTGAGADGAPPPPGSQPQSIDPNALPPEPTSYNGWTVGSPGSVVGVQNYTVPGTNIVLPIRSGQVATVLLYVAQRFNAEVETLQKGQCWGYDYRPNVNNPSVWSNHASGTAIDLNSQKHQNGARGTFTAAQKVAVREILAFCGDVVYWGEDYRGTVDGMHFEIDVPPGSAELAALVNKIAGGSADPRGFLDGVVDTGYGTVQVSGWAYDPDVSSTEIPVAIYADDAGVGWFPTGVSRNDVNRVFGISGAHGFDVPIKLSAGVHSVAVYAINSGGGSSNPLIGVKSVVVSGTSIGYLEAATAVGGGIRLTGWAYDPDDPTTEISIAVKLDKASVGRFPTGQPRPDVNAFLGAGGRHGFDITVKAGPGNHTVDVYGVNIGSGSANPLLDSRRVLVGAVPVGVIDSLAASGRTVRIRGWAYDPDQPATEISVAVYRNNVGVAWFPTGVTRTDVNAAFGISGKHGYDIVIPDVPAGDQSFSVWGINVGPAGNNPLLATRSVRVG